MTPALAGDDAVPFRVPARFLAVGAVALAAFWTPLAISRQWALAHVQRPGVLALTHVFTLPFTASVLIGALHQLVPVLLVGRLHAPGWGDATWVATTAGGVALVVGFALGARPAWLATGGLLALAGATARPLPIGDVAGLLHVLLTVALVTAAGGLALDVRAILCRRMRRRPDVYVTTFLAGVGVFLLAAVLVTVGRPEEAVILALLGALAPAIAGMQVKIAGFLVWNHRYAGRIGREPGGTPMLTDMTVPVLGRATGAGLLVAAALTVTARLLEGGAAITPAPWPLGLARAAARRASVGPP